MRGIWIAVMSGLVVLLAALLVVVSHEALSVAAELDRRLTAQEICRPEAVHAHARREVAQPSGPVASGWTAADQQQLQARVQAIVAVPKR